MDTSSLGAEALEKLKAVFAAERWAKIERQAARSAEDLQALCTRLLATSWVRHPDNEAAAVASAANRLLLALGSVLKPEDVERFESALAGVKDSETTSRKKRGGKHDPAPPAQ